MTRQPRQREHGGQGQRVHSHTGRSEAHAPGGAGSWQEEIRHHLRPGYVVLGVGSRLRGDDAVGPVIAERLAERGFERAFDCGEVPENCLGKIEKLQPPDILFVDVADFEREPGAIGFFGGESFQIQSVSTHSAGLSPLMDFLSASCRAVFYVLAVQPADLTYGADLSDPVRQAVEEIVTAPVWLELSQ